MDCQANSDLCYLRDEKFDFDVSLSPASSKDEEEEEDEVFVGPISHKERCVSVHVASRLKDVGVSARGSWSPLTGDQLEAVCKEAHRLADQLQSSDAMERQHSEDEGNSSNTMTNGEQFVQDTEAKLGLFIQPVRICSPIKRETFCVQDSPLKELPPAIQQRLLRGSSTTAASSTRPATNTRLSTSSPASGAKAKPRTALRGRSMLGVSNVLPSKPTSLPASSSTTKSRVEKTRLQPPSRKAVGLKKSPTSRSSSRVPSSEDLLSDSASVASDISDTSLNSSLLSKRTLPLSNKGAVRTISGVKAPPPPTRRMTDRKNTSSSSSSVSSFNSSISLSPKGKPNSSLNRSLSTSMGPATSSISRSVNQTRQRRSNICTAAESSSSAAGRRSLSTQARKLSEAENVKAARSTPLKRAEATPLQPTKRLLEKTAPVASAQKQSGLKARPRPQALVPPTPNGGVRAVRNGDSLSSPNVSNMVKPKRLTSVTSMESVGPPTPSAGGSRLLQLKARRPSALPTPVKRRISSIPMATPTNHTRATKPSAPSDSDPASVRRAISRSPVPTNAQVEDSADAHAIKPFCLDEETPSIPSPSVMQANQQESPNTDLSSPSESEQSEEPQNQSGPSRDLIELEMAEESSSKTQESSAPFHHQVLLLDLPAPILHPQEKMLIDLNNTPDLIRTTGKICPPGQQLIDLSSPLIKWSPDDKKENNAPLINLSF